MNEKMIVFDCGENFRSNTATPCTREWLEKQLDSALTEQYCVMAEMGVENAKGSLPVVYPHATFLNGVRRNDNAQDSGLVMLDLDDKEQQLGLDAELEARRVVERLKDFPEVLAVHISPSRRGLHVISKKVGAGSLIQEQERLFKGLFPEVNPLCLDTSTKDMARASCLVPRSHFTYLNLDELFGGAWDERYVESLSGQAEEHTAESAMQKVEERTTTMTVVKTEERPVVKFDECPTVKTEANITNPSLDAKLKAQISQDRTMLGDVLYTDIVEALDKELGNLGEKGARHQSVLELCRHLAFICLDSLHMESVLPVWALAHREHKSCIEGAMNYVKGKTMPAALNRVLMRLQGSEELERDEAPRLPRNLHPAIEACVFPFPDSRKEVFALMSLPYLGTLAGCATFLYRNNEVHYPGFNCCLMAEQASGKSGLGRLEEVLIKPLFEQDMETRRKMDEYKDTINSAASDAEKPKDPHYGLRVLNPISTKAALLENIKNNRGKRAIMTVPEIDALSRRDNWANDYGQLERLMFDTDWGGQDTKSATATSALVRMGVNIATSGTPRAVMRHYANTEDGLTSRIGICTFPHSSNGSEEERPRSEANLKKIEKIQQTLMAEEPQEKPYEVKKLLKTMLEWCDRMGKVSDMLGNPAIGIYRKRAAVMGFRAGCILWLLDGKKVTPRALEFALWVASYVLYNQLKFFGNSLNRAIEKNREIMQAKAPNLSASQFVFSTIPDNFTYAQVTNALTLQGQLGSGYRTIVSRWKENGWVTCIGRGIFMKTELGKHVLSQIAAA